MKIISAEQVGNRLNDWRIAIRKHDVHNAKDTLHRIKGITSRDGRESGGLDLLFIARRQV